MLVIDTKVIDYRYFMDEIQPYELQLLSEMTPWATRQGMEETRMLMYTFCAPYMKNKKKITDFYPLPTDVKEPIERLEGEELKDVRARIQQAFKLNK